MWSGVREIGRWGGGLYPPDFLNKEKAYDPVILGISYLRRATVCEGVGMTETASAMQECMFPPP